MEIVAQIVDELPNGSGRPANEQAEKLYDLLVKAPDKPMLLATFTDEKELDRVKTSLRKRPGVLVSVRTVEGTRTLFGQYSPPAR